MALEARGTSSHGPMQPARDAGQSPRLAPARGPTTGARSSGATAAFLVSGTMALVVAFGAEGAVGTSAADVLFSVGIPGVLAATLGGLFLGPSAIRRLPGWPTGTIVGLALLTTLLGAFLVGFMNSLPGAIENEGLVPGIVQALLLSLVLLPFGLLLYGLVALPATLFGAIAWAWVLRRWRGGIAEG